MPEIDKLLRHLKENKGSDLHLSAGLPPRVRVRGALEEVPGWPVLSDAAVAGIMQEFCEPRHWQAFVETNDCDFAYGLPGIARFRVNFFRQQNGASAIARIIPETILSLEQLNALPVIASFADLTQGLVLVTGPTGSGKSTTLAGIIDRINTTYSKHIVTIEDPVEFVHQPKKCLFSHREVGRHTKSFAHALKAAIRQDADVVLVGELREYETISLALQAAEMGCLVFGTLHTNSAAKTIDRLIDAFPAEEQDQARLMLSESLAGIVSQLLLKTADGAGRCAVQEILVRTPGLPNLIREANVPMIYSTIQSGKALGMQTMDEALMDLVKSHRVTADDAYMKAMDKSRFEKMLKGAPAVV